MLFVFFLILGAFSYPPCPSEARVSPVATGMELKLKLRRVFHQTCADTATVKMDAPGILTTCAACAAPLAHDAPRCVRCKLRLRPGLMPIATKKHKIRVAMANTLSPTSPSPPIPARAGPGCDAAPLRFFPVFRTSFLPPGLAAVLY